MLKELMKFGLTENEAKCYVSLLKLSKSSASTLCKATGIPDSKIYKVLDSLEEKGFVKVEEDIPKKYIPCDPEKCIEKAYQKIVEDLDRAKKILIDLKNIYHEKNPEIQIIKGRSKIIENLGEILAKENKIKIAIYRKDEIPISLAELKDMLEGKECKIIVGDREFLKYFPDARVDSRYFLHSLILVTKKAILLTPPIPMRKKIAYLSFNSDSIELAEKTFDHLWEESKK